ncbi:hypothetical protein AURDEDRAFT_174943 [Auricularia subglabra TFB-10046 SS5]|uniref:Uncharacterized protein n=1 Tax=Auricularia subglabra (strain TFB-10046 / SS5) TaxID=717982 RepID=J0LFH0_AURST|nr:hypothetical protein AURDEDRAFT_174943 [Auricularia subglabra TFB-10046 SS5]
MSPDPLTIDALVEAAKRLNKRPRSQSPPGDSSSRGSKRPTILVKHRPTLTPQPMLSRQPPQPVSSGEAAELSKVISALKKTDHIRRVSPPKRDSEGAVVSIQVQCAYCWSDLWLQGKYWQFLGLLLLHVRSCGAAPDVVKYAADANLRAVEDPKADKENRA